jgi:hypothetical protein
MSLAPAMVIVRAYKKQPENIGLFGCQNQTICREYESKNETNACESTNRLFHHGFSSLVK